MYKIVTSIIACLLASSSMLAQTRPGVWGRAIVPESHPIHEMMRRPSTAFADVDTLYRLEIEQVTGVDYADNLKNMGFHLAMERGLLKEGTDRQLRYYFDQQMGLRSNLPNFTNFYRLLVASRRFMGLEETKACAHVFHTKNEDAIRNLMLDDNEKQALLAQLSQARILFEELGVY